MTGGEGLLLRAAQVAIPTVLAEGSREAAEHFGADQGTQGAVRAAAGFVGDLVAHKVPDVRLRPPRVRPSVPASAPSADINQSIRELRRTVAEEARRIREREQERLARLGLSGLLAARGVADAVMGRRDDPER